MGQVFLWDSIYEGRVPKLESFQRVSSVLREAFSVEPAIVGALLFGSVVRGDFNVRSDVDCVVIYKTEQERWAREALHEVSRTARALHVPINFTPCDTVLAKTRLHHFGGSFVRHLQSSIDKGGLIKGDFTKMLSPPTISAWEEIESYVKMKMYQLQAGFVQSAFFNEKETVRLLRKALEAPTHVARKMLIYEGTLQGESKREVQARYRETMPLHFADEFDHLLDVDARYSLELDYQLRNPDLMQYAATLVELLSKLPKVLAFLRSNILRLDAAR